VDLGELSISLFFCCSFSIHSLSHIGQYGSDAGSRLWLSGLLYVGCHPSVKAISPPHLMHFMLSLLVLLADLESFFDDMA